MASKPESRRRSGQSPIESYQVGYGKPPTASQFKKGVSGNPNGRPGGKVNFATAIRRALQEKVTIIENNKKRTISKLDAAVKQVINKAASGDSRAFQQVVQLTSVFEQDDSNLLNTPAHHELDDMLIAQFFKQNNITLDTPVDQPEIDSGSNVSSDEIPTQSGE